MTEWILGVFVLIVSLHCNRVFSQLKWFKFLTNCCPGFPRLGWLTRKWPRHIINKEKNVTGPTSCVIKSMCCNVCEA